MTSRVSVVLDADVWREVWRDVWQVGQDEERIVFAGAEVEVDGEDVWIDFRRGVKKEGVQDP